MMLPTACSVPVAKAVPVAETAPIVAAPTEAAAPASAAEERYPEFGVTPGRKCGAAGLARFMGQPGTREVLEALRTASNSATLRTFGPGQALTQDYRENRLNVGLDARGGILSARCG